MSSSRTAPFVLVVVIAAAALSAALTAADAHASVGSGLHRRAMPPSSSAAAGNPSPSTLYCGVCEAGIDAIETNKTDTEIMDDLRKVCTSVLPKALATDCVKGIDDMAKLVGSQDQGILVKYSTFALCSIMGACAFDCCSTPFTPEQIHIAVAGNNSRDISVQWVTLQEVSNASVIWGTSTNSLTNFAPATAHPMQIYGWRGVIYRAVMTNLAPATTYHYRVGSFTDKQFYPHPAGSQPDLKFTTESVEPYPVRVACVGDIGGDDPSDFTVLRIADGINSGLFNLSLFDGDLSYADGVEFIEDMYQRKIEVLAAFAPHMTAPGNHEGFTDFITYKARYNVPYEESGSTDPLYYSFNYGGIHFINYNTEGPMGISIGDIQSNTPQYQWLLNDLIQANKNRDKQPWIVVSGHRALYCSANKEDCQTLSELLRKDLEDLFMQQKVDIVMQAHLHYYECFYPTYNSTKMGNDFNNPKAPVYIVNGAGGNKEHVTGFPSTFPDIVAAAYGVYGYGVLTAHDASNLQWQFYEAQSNSILHDITITRP
ncbi:hypothetical protein CAOG_07432 [Capsaspora owczarzaki ATCC 30864]|uniref:Purple acid phosphatase n=1 Tax=Capsaspora owczarzaki (strain ATCC 30864) TaxID=595528 RepID=A0A0D2X5D2_CAPO3|nr:hypothetical protein CAOG_07432 [Capsaspora owczarzaki ATCC 30864]KJE97604.1 hypothetical protein CAOG_007432 [Capsaspora owczarzaki ATCC 30864]|eukprot:XP_004343291.2 hypothetical protein CAOG_07432 [Capsaspora owczarzaki ATCC 30864]